jgi:4-hydroxythreonine-4-phosphate dehydrogenase
VHTSAHEKPVIAITMGDPVGIGPEVIAKALADEQLRQRIIVRIFGVDAPLRAAAGRAGIEPFWQTLPHDAHIPSDAGVVLLEYNESYLPPETPGPSATGGELSFRFVTDAIRCAMLDPNDPAHVDAIVTAPISKTSWKLAGHDTYPGHTELLAERFNADRHAMMFVSETLRVVLATIHIPLMAVGPALTTSRILDVIELGAEACRRLGIAGPRVAVCGLNPHAGEGGLFGDEEPRLIEPAIQQARSRGIDATGPHPADTVFNQAVDLRRHDLVVAMYHDQGLIPVKLLAWDSAVNVTLGLPTARTSPDHGTAFDIAGTGTADPGSFRAALDLACAFVETV